MLINLEYLIKPSRELKISWVLAQKSSPMALGLGLLRRNEIKEAKGVKEANPHMMTTLASLTLRQMSSKKISPCQKIFARNLASGMSQTDAAVEAGYSVTRA